MSVVYQQRRTLVDRLSALGHTDFCPWANRYVYWLKQPIGWFAIAGLLSLLVGAFVNPNGWILMSVIVVIMAVGIIWPWFAVRAVVAELEPSVDCVYEGDEVELIVRMRNRWLMPQFGISIDGFLDRPSEDELPMPSVALSCVPAMSQATYHLAVTPELRGHYPLRAPTIACAFPFGIWTARRELKNVTPMTVWPKVFPVLDEIDFGGNDAADAGEGTRSGQVGEPLGVRDFRRGDRLKSVHWVHTARTGRLVVCERGGPQRQEIELCLDPRCGRCSGGIGNDCQESSVTKQFLSQRIRLVASVALQLHARHTHLVLQIGESKHRISCNARGQRQILDLLAAIPHEGLVFDFDKASLNDRQVTLTVSPGAKAEETNITLKGNTEFPVHSIRTFVVPFLTSDLEEHLARFWRDLRGARRVA